MIFEIFSLSLGKYMSKVIFNFQVFKIKNINFKKLTIFKVLYLSQTYLNCFEKFVKYEKYIFVTGKSFSHYTFRIIAK